MRKLILMMLLAIFSINANGSDDRFIEVPNDISTTTFDLSTVQVIQPGRFSVVKTTIDNPDLMKFELKVLDAVEPYCKKPEGAYPATTDMLAMGYPDMPVGNITVTGHSDGKSLYWDYPYKKLNGASMLLFCRGEDHQGKNEDESYWYLHERSRITNGIQSKELYDCKRGLWGYFMDMNDDPSKALTSAVKPNTAGEYDYLLVCRAVLHDKPYLPDPKHSADSH